MYSKNFKIIALLLFAGCAPPSNAVPDYAATRIRVNAGTAQSASLEAKDSVADIKRSNDELRSISQEVENLRQEIQSTRMKLSR